jgi:hypothetical protein
VVVIIPYSLLNFFIGWEFVNYLNYAW